MLKIIPHDSDTEPSTSDRSMRYFIYYPPTRSIRLIEVSENVLVEDVLTLVKQEFNLNTQNTTTAETSIVLNFNGSDLKPKWSLVDLSIPSGSIIRCLYREEKAADLYIFCSYNKQIFKLYDSSITLDTTMGTIRKKISDQIGLPLSVYCLETYHSKQRLYDDMTLSNYDLKIHDHIYLKVWCGYEKLINACVKGFSDQYAYDDLTRHYQTQVALHIAAFYGHMDLANSAIQQGARSDHPVGEHPSRQWSSELSSQTLPELLKCPIHIAVERGHVKIVDLFVRQSIICTQVRDPITNHLPYKLALSCSLLTKIKEKQENYRSVYFYLHDKQFNLRIPINATAEYVSDLLTSTVSATAVHRRSSNYVYVSLPFYCRIIQWYERARDKVWKKYGARLYNASQTKRIYPKQGLLGYKVLIDGFNNSFEVPTEQSRNVRSGGTIQSSQDGHYTGLDNEEQKKINEMKKFIKDFALDERIRAKQKAVQNLQQSRRPRLLLSSPAKTNQNRNSKKPLKQIRSSYEISNNQRQLTNITMKTSKSFVESQSPLTPNVTPAAFAKQMAERYLFNDKLKHSTKPTHEILSASSSSSSSSPLPSVNDEETLGLPIIYSPTITQQSHSSLTNRLDTVTSTNKNNFPGMMSSADAYALSSSHIAKEREQQKLVKRKELFAQIEQSQNQLKQITKVLPSSDSSDRKEFNTDTHIQLPDRPTVQRADILKSRRDCALHQATVNSYERYASATTRSTAIQCLQEASYFKGKSWLKQVEISKEMMKHNVKRRIRRANDDTTNKPILLPLRTNIVETSATTNRPNTVKVN